VKRVAVIYYDEPRPETSGGYCLRALRDLVEAAHLRPEQAPSTAPGKFDLYLRIDDGVRRPIPRDLGSNAVWVIDMHHDFEDSLARVQDFDVVFAAQKQGAGRLRRGGGGALATPPRRSRDSPVPWASSARWKFWAGVNWTGTIKLFADRRLGTVDDPRRKKE